MNVVQVGNIIQNLFVGDRVIINDWENAFTVLAESENFIIVYCQESDEYSIISKTLATFTYNSVMSGTYFCGPDNFIFSKFDPKDVQSYLLELEDPNNTLMISKRKSVTIHNISVQH